MAYACKVLLASLAPCGARLTTLEITFPRIVLAEFNTHRLLSRSSASSRAIPVTKRIQSVIDDPFVPEEFGSNRPGMQAGDPLAGAEKIAAFADWMRARNEAVESALRLNDRGVHKQLANRLLEPFLWHTVVVSATEWDNFFAQRCHPAAQPEIRRIAEMMRGVWEESTPVRMSAGEWHMPYVTGVEMSAYTGGVAHVPGIDWRKVSVARCARVSYLTQDGRRDVEEDLALFERLRTAQPMHASPFEHVAQALNTAASSGNFVGWRQFRKLFANEHAGPRRDDNRADGHGLLDDALGD